MTWQNLDHITFPVWVTSPKSPTFTSIIVPFVITPSEVYNLDWGFFFIDNIGSLKVALS